MLQSLQHILDSWRCSINYRIKSLWNSDAKVWIATSQNVPGLVLESSSFDALLERIRITISELLKMNNKKQPVYNLIFEAERIGTASAYG